MGGQVRNSVEEVKGWKQGTILPSLLSSRGGAMGGYGDGRRLLSERAEDCKGKVQILLDQVYGVKAALGELCHNGSESTLTLTPAVHCRTNL